MFLEGLFSLLNNILLFTSKIENNNSFPKPLSKEKEKEYLERYHAGDMSARDVLIRHNLRLVAYIAKKYSNYNDQDELISIGSLGLVKAISSYKLNTGTALATYASRCIENEILMTMRSNKKLQNNVFLYESIGVDKDGNEMTFIDMLAGSEEEMFFAMDRKILAEKVQKIIKSALTPREQQVIVLRFGLDGLGARSQQVVGDRLKISRSYVSRIEKKALRKIKCEVEDKGVRF